MTITLDQARGLYHGQELYCDTDRNSDGTPLVWRVNGKVKTWKRDTGRIEVPIKHGLYDFGYLTEKLLGLVHLSAEDAMGDSRYQIKVTSYSKTVHVHVKDVLDHRHNRKVILTRTEQIDYVLSCPYSVVVDSLGVFVFFAECTFKLDCDNGILSDERDGQIYAP